MALYPRVILFMTIAHSSVSYPLESEVRKMAHECRQAEQATAQREADLENVSSLYYQKTEHLKRQQKKISRLIILFKNLKREAPSYVIQSHHTGHQVLRDFFVLQCYIQTLHNQMSALQKELLSLQHTKHESLEKKKELEEKLKTYQEKYARLEGLLQQRQREIHKTLTHRQEKEERAKKIAERSQSLSELIKKMEQEQPLGKEPSLPSSSLSLLAPVQGPLIVNFNQKHEENPDGSGVVFRTRPGAHVLAPVSGKILYAGPFRRYKQILIIGFQKTYSLLLTGLTRLDVSVGQEIRVGDPIGLLSNEGKNYVYLELRNHGIPIKPHIVKT